MRKGVRVFFILSLVVFSSMFVSAGWFSDFFGKVTGNVINSQQPCGTSYTCRDISYAGSLKLNVHLPKNVSAPYPVVVFFSPGSWVAGDRTACEHTQSGKSYANTLTSKGIAVVCVDYSLTSQSSKNTFPKQIHEAKAAVRWVRANAQKYGFDPNRVGAWGASAGGHQAAMLGTTIEMSEFEGVLGNKDYSSAVQAVALLVGPTHFYPLSQISDGSQNRAIYMYLGRDMAKDPTGYIALATIADATMYVNGNEPPFLLQYGADDTLVPAIHGQKLHQKLISVGLFSDLKVYPYGGHGGFMADGQNGFDYLANFFIDKLNVSKKSEFTIYPNCEVNYWGRIYFGRNGFVGLNNSMNPNIDYRFICLDSRFYECGWELNEPNFAVKVIDNQKIGNYTCNLASRKWESYSVPEIVSYNYSWQVGNWSSCSGGNCSGGGVQTRLVECRRNDGAIVSDSFCLEFKPFSSQSCISVICSGNQECQQDLCTLQNISVVNNSVINGSFINDSNISSNNLSDLPVDIISLPSSNETFIDLPINHEENISNQTSDPVMNFGKNCKGWFGVGYTGEHNEVGLSNGDPRFFCYDGIMYECGWSKLFPFPPLAKKAKNAEVVHGYMCDVTTSRWVKT